MEIRRRAHLAQGRPGFSQKRLSLREDGRVVYRLRLIAVLTDPEIVGGILRHLGLPDTPPPVAPARGPPQETLSFDPASS